MATVLTMIELQKMSKSDLQREVAEQSMLVAGLKMGIELQREKDSARYRREKRQLARMKSVLTQTAKKTSTPSK